MSKVIIYTNPGMGNVAVCTPTGEVSIDQVLAVAIPAGVQSYVVDRSTLPEEDNDFFNAWEQTDGVITVNLSKAKEITKTRLRTEREPLLAAQDVLYMRALEAGQDVTAIVAEKVRLRDVTNLADSCTTLDELRALKAAA